MENIFYRSNRINRTEDKEYNNFVHQFREAPLMSDNFALDCLRSHNHFRTQHGCPPLHLSTEVSEFSQQWANQIAREDRLFHSHHSIYGENLFVMHTNENACPLTKVTGSQVVESWYSEHRLYPANGHVTRETILKAGHFTQVIWRKSRELGIGKAVSRSNRLYVVANYNPAGNILKQISANVPKRIFSCGRNHYSYRLFSRRMGFHQELCINSYTEH